jgi:signal transduction histidine kinase
VVWRGCSPLPALTVWPAFALSVFLHLWYAAPAVPVLLFFFWLPGLFFGDGKIPNRTYALLAVAAVFILRADDCWLKGDPALLRSCIENVMRNAVHFTKPQTEVAVSVDLVGGSSDSARILVADHGDGVPPELLDRIFEPFYRVTEASEHQTGGTGLGLSIAQRIAIIHGGSIRASNRDGGGLEMEIRLPAQRPVSVPPYTK